MYRIDTSSSSPDPATIPAAGTRGYFRDENPASGIAGTIVPAWWCNMLQEEIENAVLAAGLTPQKGNHSQLSAAILALVASGGIATGVVVSTIATVPAAGWVMMNDTSIGSVASSATGRANADTQALFTMIWNNINNTWAPTQTSAGAPVARGGSAALDFAANRRLVLPRALGRVLAGAGSGSGLTTRELGSFTGEEAHTLTGGEMQHQHHLNMVNQAQGPAGGVNVPTTPTAGVDFVAAAPHNTMQPTLFLNMMIKL